MNHLQLTLLFIWLMTISFASSELQSCLKCDSSNEKCKDGPFDGLSAACTTACFTKLETDKMSRDCLATAETACDGPNCKKCTENDCNKHKTCRVCDSTKATCLTNNLDDTQVCPLTSPNCIVQLTAEHTVTRDCANDDAKAKCGENPNTCSACTTSNCNAKIFPEKRIQCQHCDGKDCNDVTKSAASPCTLYDEKDQCFTYGTSDADMLRGCSSDKNAKCTASEAACTFCDSDNCNSLQFKRKPALQCVTCVSSEKDAACIGAQKPADAKDCTNELQYNQSDMCYIQKKNGIVHRGCFYDRTAELGECSEKTSCTTCTIDKGCNFMAMEFTCIRCRSDETAQCRNEADKLTGQSCTNPNGEKSGCYFGTWKNVVIRGCMADASPSMQYQCTNKDDKTCQQCDGADCNKGKAGASALSALGSLLLASIAVVTWRLC